MSEAMGAVLILLILMVVIAGLVIYIAMKIKRYDERLRGKDKK